MKSCSRCKEQKPLEEFYKCKRNKDGYQYMCKVCDRAAHTAWRKNNSEKDREYSRRWSMNHPRQVMLMSARKRAKAKGLAFGLTLDNMPNLGTHCPITGRKFVRGVGGTCGDSPSLDRIVPELGYVPENVQVISHSANVAKSHTDGSK